MTQPTPPSLEPLLAAAEFHLSKRNFPSCRIYALRALEISPNHPNAAQLLAISDTLSSSSVSQTLTDHYSVLQIPQFSTDTDLIRHQSKKLTLLLHDSQYPFAQQAFSLAHKAWSVLGSPEKKAQFDQQLSHAKGEGTFWTTCPYCLYMYEYGRVYENCCVRCQSESCRRGFTAAEVKAPPDEAVEKGRYECFGFFPLGFCGGGGGEWKPFSNVVEVERDGENGSNDSSLGVGIGRKRRMKKSVPRNAKKVMGRGCRVRRMDLNAEVGEDESDKGNGGGDFDTSEVEVLAGEDDIFVSFPDCF